MIKEFIPYELAIALKELGFDETCFLSYNPNPNWWDNYCTNSEISSLNGGSNIVCSAPLYQQAFRWFREKHKLKGHIEAVEYLDGTPDTYHWCVFDKFNSGYDQLTYEEAELECLKKLIEIVKKRSNE